MVSVEVTAPAVSAQKTISNIWLRSEKEWRLDNNIPFTRDVLSAFYILRIDEHRSCSPLLRPPNSPHAIDKITNGHGKVSTTIQTKPRIPWPRLGFWPIREVGGRVWNTSGLDYGSGQHGSCSVFVLPPFRRLR